MSPTIGCVLLTLYPWLCILCLHSLTLSPSPVTLGLHSLTLSPSPTTLTLKVSCSRNQALQMASAIFLSAKGSSLGMNPWSLWPGTLLNVPLQSLYLSELVLTTLSWLPQGSGAPKVSIRAPPLRAGSKSPTHRSPFPLTRPNLNYMNPGSQRI